LNYEPCQPAQPVSVIHFHGTDDTHLPYNGGQGADSLTGVPYNSVADSLRFWLDFDQCPLFPKQNPSLIFNTTPMPARSRQR